MEQFLKYACETNALTAITVTLHMRNSVPFVAFAHNSAGECGCGDGDTVEVAIENAIEDLQHRFRRAAS